MSVRFTTKNRQTQLRGVRDQNTPYHQSSFMANSMMDGSNTSTRSNGHPTEHDSHGKNDVLHAPTYSVPRRRFGAVEHPMMIRDIEKGIATFGRGHSFRSIVDSSNPQISIPLFFRPDNPTVRPLTSHNAATHNVLLKVTVPKRTGRKRKRGTDDPFEYHDQDSSQGNGPQQDGSSDGSNVMSQGGLDRPAVVRRKLQDNIGRYAVQPVGIIYNTHRYRGLSDFQYSMSNSNFMSTFVNQVLPGSVPQLRQYAINNGTAQPPNIDLIPPPFFAPHGMPNVYNYAQNPFVRGKDGTDVPTYDGPPAFFAPPSSSSGSDEDSDASDASAEFNKVVNTSMRGAAPGYFIRYNDFPAPLRPRHPPDLSDPHVRAVMGELMAAMSERPVWTRRSMFNRLSSAVSSLPKSGNIIKHCIQYAGYQFRGGPWRDSLVKYGVDPREDPKYRVYQTLIFKLHKRQVGNVGGTWQSVRRKEVSTLSGSFGRYWKGVDDGVDRSEGHKFDGTSFSTDGKVWQVCDISDPLLKRLFDEAVPLPVCDFEKSGWYSPVLWCVAKAIMKRKMLAIRFKRDIPDEAYHEALDIVRRAAEGEMADIDNLTVPLPPLHLSAEEREQIRGRRVKTGRKGRDRDKTKNAPLRIRHMASDKPREVRIVQYPGDDRVVADMSYPPSVVDSARGTPRKSGLVGEGDVGGVVGEDEDEGEEEELDDLLNSEDDDDDDEEEEEEEEEDEMEDEEEEEDEELEADEDEDEEDESEEEDDVLAVEEGIGEEVEDDYDEDDYGEGPSTGTGW